MVNDRAKIATEVRSKSGVAPQGQRQGTQTILILLHPSGTIEGLVALRSTGLHRNSTNPVVVPAAALTSACNGPPSRIGCLWVGVMGSCRSMYLGMQGVPSFDGGFGVGVIGSCCSNDLIAHRRPMESWSCVLRVMWSCCSTDLSMQQGAIAVLSCLVRSEAVLLQH